MEFTNIHRVRTLQEISWLKSYFNWNTEKRKHAPNDIVKYFFKLMNKSDFSQTMGNLRKTVVVKLVNDIVKLSK